MGRPIKQNLSPELSKLLKTIGSNLTAVREELGVSQSWLAKECKVSLTTINELESRKSRDIRISTLVAICGALGVPIYRLFQNSDVKMNAADRAKLLKASEDILRITKKINDD